MVVFFTTVCLEQVVMDANPPVGTMQALGEMCVSANVSLWYEPTSIPKSSRLLQAPAALQATKWLSPNLYELSAMAEAAVQLQAGVDATGFEDLHREVTEAVQNLPLPDADEKHKVETIGSNLATLLQAMVGKDGTAAPFPRQSVLLVLNLSRALRVAGT
eukprot:COSAG06_NODE_2989_length_5984_cov_4.027698_3_plen_160_part_00